MVKYQLFIIVLLKILKTHLIIHIKKFSKNIRIFFTVSLELLTA